jgi:hypothetical protein
MTSLETKPTPSGPKKSNTISFESLKHQPEASSQTSASGSRNISQKKKHTIDILDDWDPNRDGMATHIEFIHQSMMDLAAGIEKIALIADKVEIVSGKRLETIEESHVSLGKRLETIKKSHTSLHKGQNSITKRLIEIEERLQKKIEDSSIALSTSFENNTRADPEENTSLVSTPKQEDIQLLLSGNTDVINNNLQHMEDRLHKKIENSKVELSTTFETEAEICRNIYITEMVSQINTIKGKGSSVRYMGKRETQAPSISRLSSILPSFGEEAPPKKPLIVTVIPKDEE